MFKLNRIRRIVLFIIAIVGACSIYAWSMSQKVEKAPQSKQPLAHAQASPQNKGFQKFIVYQDKPSANHYVISGFMPNGKCAEMNDVWVDNCQEGRSCIKGVFNRDCATLGMGWAGVYWLQPANNWGDQKGFDLTGAKRLVFWAKGEKGGEVLIFKMGGVGLGRQFPDTDAVATEPVTLFKDWKEYSIDLKDKKLSNIAGGFAWVGSAKDNPQNITFYLDNIHYE
ncbi:MAG: hypothetical protein HY591_04690 [Candidatus Omnitrophica bacterium]|nr:hypothetical protein [Candidatus Omnitrophota bacterium]